ncbi:MAG: LacI family transcriptional regulator, partial [Eubacterium sp.]|nr:LacI family transcriptional regulator [Eubacterium sp.]
MLNGKLFIGIITARVSESEQRKLLAGILSQAEKYNIHAAVFSNIYNFNEYYADVEVENKIYDLIESERLDGIILAAESIMNHELQTFIYNKICSRNIPVVVTDAIIDEFICVNNNVRSDFQDIARHLIDIHEFKDIDILTGCENLETSHERVAGVRDVFEERNIPFSEKNIIYGDFWKDSGERLAMEYISGKRNLPQAIICASDYMAYGLIDTFFENDIAVPDDVTVISYEYVGERFNHSPILTTYHRNREAVGAKAVSILYSMITGSPEEEISLNGCMIYGNTCSCKIDREHLKIELNNVRNVQYYTNLNLCGNFEQQLTSCRSIKDYIKVLQDFSYLIRNIAGIYLCLYENWCSLNEKTNIYVNTNAEIMTFYRIISPEYSDSNPHFFKRHMLFPEELYG